MDEGPLIFIVAIGVSLLIPMALCRRRAPEETGLVPRYEEIGSGTLGWFISTRIPCIRLSIYEDFFVVAFLKPKVIPLGKRISVANKKWLFSNRLLIEVDGKMAWQLSVKSVDTAIRLLRRQ